MRTYRKIDEFTETFKHFTLTQWYFKNTNTQALWKKLNATDRQLFEFDMSCLNWQSYYYVYMRGIRIYVLKDPLETVITGAAKYFKLKIMHYICVGIVCFFAGNWTTLYIAKIFSTRWIIRCMFVSVLVTCIIKIKTILNWFLSVLCTCSLALNRLEYELIADQTLTCPY